MKQYWYFLLLPALLVLILLLAGCHRNDVFIPDEKEPANSDIESIVDHSREPGISTASAFEKFWEDDHYNYYFSSIKSSLVEVTMKNGETYTVTEALEKGFITIPDLDDFHIGYSRERK